MVMPLSRKLEFVAGPFDLGRNKPLLVPDLGSEDADFADRRFVKEFGSFPWARLSQIRSAQAACRSARRIHGSIVLGGSSNTTLSSRHALANKMYAVTPSAAVQGEKKRQGCTYSRLARVCGRRPGFDLGCRIAGSGGDCFRAYAGIPNLFAWQVVRRLANKRCGPP